eukprot:g16094.t1
MMSPAEALEFYAAEVLAHPAAGKTARAVAAEARAKAAAVQQALLAAQQAADAANVAAVMGENYLGDIGDLIAQQNPPKAAAQPAAPVGPAAAVQQDVGAPLAQVLPPPPPPHPAVGVPPAQYPHGKGPLVPFPPEAVDDDNLSPALSAVVNPPAFPKYMPPPPAPQQADPVAGNVRVSSPKAKAASAAKAAGAGAIPVFQGPTRNAPLPQPPTPAEAAVLYPQVAKAKNPNALHHGTLSWETVLGDMLGMKESGDPRGSVEGAALPDGDSDEESAPLPVPNAAAPGAAGASDNLILFDAHDVRHQVQSVKLMKAQYVLRYVQLMRRLGLSTKRENVSGKSIELLFKSFFLCGDFRRSKVQYFSWVKNYITRKRDLSAEAAASYSKWLAVLHRNKIPQAQEQGIRLTHVVRMCHAIRHSVDSVIVVTKRRRASTGLPIQFTAGQMMRQIICCWFAFLRPDEAGRTTRTLKRVGGRDCVTYHIPFRKNRPRSHFEADFRCMCSYAVCLKIPVCPVCAQDSETWRLIGTYVDSDIWAKTIRQLVFAAAIPSPVINGRWAINAHSIRIGGAHSAQDGGLDGDSIRKIGDWSSHDTADHYIGSSRVLADAYAIRWPLRKAVVFSEETHANFA